MAQTYEEFTAAIGNTVLSFARIESMMGLLISFQYARRESYDAFTADVLGDESFSYGLRCNAVRKALVRNGLTEREASAAIQPLRDLGGARNLIAHIGKVPFAGQEGAYLHPKRGGTVINADELPALCAQYDEQYEKAFTLLKGWLEPPPPPWTVFYAASRLDFNINSNSIGLT
jgi:hypothetical protein